MNVVHKYGGTSVATIEKINAVADRIAEIKKAGNNIAVVASAMGKTTDRLIEMAKTVNENPSERELDSCLLYTSTIPSHTLLLQEATSFCMPSISTTQTLQAAISFISLR